MRSQIHRSESLELAMPHAIRGKSCKIIIEFISEIPTLEHKCGNKSILSIDLGVTRNRPEADRLVKQAC
jgi:hypothetical protein